MHEPRNINAVAEAAAIVVAAAIIVVAAAFVVAAAIIVVAAAIIVIAASRVAIIGWLTTIIWSIRVGSHRRHILREMRRSCE